jgi:hypothetical protein
MFGCVRSSRSLSHIIRFVDVTKQFFKCGANQTQGLKRGLSIFLFYVDGFRHVRYQLFD